MYQLSENRFLNKIPLLVSAPFYPFLGSALFSKMNHLSLKHRFRYYGPYLAKTPHTNTVICPPLTRFNIPSFSKFNYILFEWLSYET